MTLTELIEAGRELSPAERVELANELLASVDDSGESAAAIDAAWNVEIGSRVEGILTGKVTTIPFDETYARLSEKIAAAKR